jgi:O-antigen/teichoic acid export membrane protein
MGASKRYIINSFVVSWLNVSLILVLVGLCHFKLGGIFFSWALSWVTGFILAWLPVKQYFQLEIAKSKLKAMLKFSFPLFLNNVPSNFNSMLDRYIVLAVLGLYSLGLYSAAASTAGILSMVSAVMQLAIWPLVYQAHKLENATRKVKTMLNTGFFFVIILAVLSIFLSGFLGKIFLGRSFLHSPSVRMIITILMLNYLVATLTNFFPGMAIARRNHYLILITLIGLIINLVLGLILVKLCGISGVPIAVLIASISQVTLYGYMSQRFFPLPFTRTDFIIFLPLGILLISIPLYITLSSMHISHLFRFGVELFIGLCLVGWGLWLYCSQKSRKFN